MPLTGRDQDDRDTQEQSAKRKLCSGLMFWTVCGRKGCRRARGCAGDAKACFSFFWPHLPEETKIRLRAGIAARHEGASFDEMTRRMDEAAELYRAASPDTGASHPQL